MMPHSRQKAQSDIKGDVSKWGWKRTVNRATQENKLCLMRLIESLNAGNKRNSLHCVTTDPDWSEAAPYSLPIPHDDKSFYFPVFVANRTEPHTRRNWWLAIKRQTAHSAAINPVIGRIKLILAITRVLLNVASSKRRRAGPYTINEHCLKYVHINAYYTFCCNSLQNALGAGTDPRVVER